MGETDLSRLAHALAEPVFVLRARAALPDGHPSELDAIAARLKAILDGVVRLDRAADRPQREPVELAEALERAKARAAEQPASLEVQAAGLPRVNADPAQMTTLLAEILENSARFCEGGAVTVTVVAAELSPGWTRVRVSDDGPGIPGDDPERAFQAFKCLVPERRADSAGVGLTVCRRIVEAHEGTISASSGPLGGTVVTFTLPTG